MSFMNRAACQEMLKTTMKSAAFAFKKAMQSNCWMKVTSHLQYWDNHKKFRLHTAQGLCGIEHPVADKWRANRNAPTCSETQAEWGDPASTTGQASADILQIIGLKDQWLELIRREIVSFLEVREFTPTIDCLFLYTNASKKHRALDDGRSKTASASVFGYPPE